MLPDLHGLKRKRMPAWLAPIVGAAVGAAMGLLALDRAPDHWREFSLAFAGIGFVAGLIVAFVDVVRRNPQITPVIPPPVSASTFPVRPFKTSPPPRPSQTFVVAPRTGVFAAAGVVLALLGAVGSFVGLSLLFGWIAPADGRSPIAPGLTMTLSGAFIVLLGVAQLSISLVRPRPIMTAFQEGISVRISKTSTLNDVPKIPDYVSTLIDFFARTPWHTAHIVLAWQSLRIAVNNDTATHKLLLAGLTPNTGTTQAASEPYTIELDETDLGTDVENLRLQLQHIASTPAVQQTFPPLPAPLPGADRVQQ